MNRLLSSDVVEKEVFQSTSLIMDTKARRKPYNTGKSSEEQSNDKTGCETDRNRKHLQH